MVLPPKRGEEGPVKIFTYEPKRKDTKTEKREALS